jgi:5-methylcytosine-specific restriction endonuclease McrA
VKTCTGCGHAKPLEAFVKDKRCKDGRQARCKECTNAAYRERYAASPEWRARKVEQDRMWAQANPEAARSRAQRWRQRHPELAKAKHAQWRAKNPGYFRAYYRANIERERERARVGMAKSRKLRPDLELQRKRRYRETNAEFVREQEREKTYARRAMVRSSPETARFMSALLTEPCAYCGATENITVDHIVPLSRGGRHEPSNLAPACLSCNSSKCALLLEEWGGRDHGEPVVP